MTAQVRSTRRWYRTRNVQKTFAFYVFIAPWLLGFITLVVVPLAIGLLISFSNYDGLNLSTVKFTGFKNYGRLGTDPDALYSLGRVAVWAALNIPLWVVTSFLLAYVLNHAIRGRGVYRTLFYLPSVVPLVAVAWIGRILLHNSFGLVNQLLSEIFPGTVVHWLSTYAMYSLTGIAVWTGLGSGIIIFLAGLQNIPVELEEAALMDGAGKLRSFLHLTIPLMTPVIFFQVILSTVAALQYFSLPMLMAPNASSNAGVLSTPPDRSVYLYMIHVLRQAFGFQRYGYATALTWILVLIIVLLTALVFWSAPRWVYYETDTR